ncbi:DoxX family protein [Streptomyces sp. adm13(2018)]|uniref:DoxX family protein n=1 Tax=Streptomyces sp. adm13(2018) TaxID=2479007 RepID=UPI0011CE4779|nr:DoxX family protein [Streptomyces sp. adm13(2018)]TXS13962.1 DoxX family protein [Streptomyces sp. adm13(2018)]
MNTPSNPSNPSKQNAQTAQNTPHDPSRAHSTGGASGLAGRLDQSQPYALGVFRIVVGLLFACHGAASLFGVLGGAMGGGTVPVGTWPGWYAAVIQLGAGGLVLLGLGTRSAAFLASGSMAYAYFKVHQPESLFPLQNGGETAALFAWAFVLLVFTGPGALALDGLFRGRVGAGAPEKRTGEEREEQATPVTA